MKKFSVLIALVLLAVAGTGYAVTCAYDNVPAATLLVPHWRVARNGSTGGDIPAGGIDTLCSITNVSATGLIAHIVLWNKYSAAVLDFNVPLTAYDVAFWSMRDILNGKLNVNPKTQAGSISADPCGLNQSNVNAPFAPSIGFGASRYIRFTNPDTRDRVQAISIYATPYAYSGLFRQRVWDNLDETQDITVFSNSAGAGILDVDSPNCGLGDANGDSDWAGDFGGYLTVDVVNYCTNYSADNLEFYVNDAIATTGWTPTYTPNSIMGDVFYLDPTANGGNISGDQMVPLEFDSRLSDWNARLTFYGRYRANESVLNYQQNLGLYPTAYMFIGDGREPLGYQYGFRYLSDSANGLQSWAIIYRSDNYVDSAFPLGGDVNLCQWLVDGGPKGEGFYDTAHQIIAAVFDNDENQYTPSGGCPSPCTTQNNALYVFLESQRIALLGNADINPANYKGGWINLTLPGFGPTVAPPGGTAPAFRTHQSYVGIQHTGPGLAISVGHSATVMSEQFLCAQSTQVLPIFVETANVP